MSADKPFNEYWRSIAHKLQSYDEAADGWKEHEEPGADADAGLTRRRFFGVMGASAALAGVSGCVRKPVENILPFADRPEDMVPGKPLFYASAFVRGGSVEGIVVESQDGRPTKIEGNPKHSGSQGATSVWAQASVLELYDRDRTRAPRQGEETIDLATFKTALGKLLERAETSGGKGLALVVREPASPTTARLLAEARQRFAQVRIFLDDPLASSNANAGAELVGGKGARAFHDLHSTHVVFAADSDFLHTEADAVRMQREWSRTRRVVGPTDLMSRLYVVEPTLTNTGVMADNRRRVRGSQVGDVVVALARELAGIDGVRMPEGLDVESLPKTALAEGLAKFVKAVAKDLASKENLGKSAILVGERQPAWVHALGLALDTALGNLGIGLDQRERDPEGPEAPKTPQSGSLRWRLDNSYAGGATGLEPLAALADALRGGEVKQVLCFDTNPAYDATADLDMASLLSKAEVVHMGLYADETAQLAKWHAPVSHFLEAWGDAVATDGTTSIQQPLIDPLHDTYSLTELLGFVASGRMVDGFTLVRATWEEQSGPLWSDRTWQQWLHEGIVSGIVREMVLPARTWNAIPEAVVTGRKPIEGLEVDFHVCPKVMDGRWANSGWLQELPHPITKLTWDNAAYMSRATAEKLGVTIMTNLGQRSGDMITVTVDGKTMELPAWVAPGQADDTVSICIGYGRKGGRVCDEAGFNANAIRSSKSPWIAAGKLQKSQGSRKLASTQDYGTMKPPAHAGWVFPERPIVLERSRAEFREDPNFVEKANFMPRDRLHHLWDPPKLLAKQQWGMSIDLNTCTGCNACVIACQSENNIPVVGKDQVLRGREMHWMRLDRYFRGDEDDPTAVVQPMACQHCESAPCETVCPVAATTHSPEGLNDMAYNRCIGTRYCSNNCPYKVRRFNYLAYNLDVRPGSFWTDDPDGALLAQLQKNPDVTVRFRGVMEKCTYCVQRINQAKIAAHVKGKDIVEDGAIITACQQVCPTDAIVFGDIRDPDSKVSRSKRSPRDYQVLRDLNTQPRTTYLARIRNPNPELG